MKQACLVPKLLAPLYMRIREPILVRLAFALHEHAQAQKLASSSIYGMHSLYMLIVHGERDLHSAYV